jgi:hypothetical protein
VVHSEREVEVAFAERVGLGALDPESYMVSGSGSGTLPAFPARVEPLDPSGGVAGEAASRRWMLRWDEGDMVAGGDIVVSVAGDVRDLAGNKAPLGSFALLSGGAVPVELSAFNLE